jgi:hypothetical protein
MVLADLDRAFRFGRYEIAAKYLKEWRELRDAQQGGAT